MAPKALPAPCGRLARYSAGRRLPSSLLRAVAPIVIPSTWPKLRVKPEVTRFLQSVVILHSV